MAIKTVRVKAYTRKYPKASTKEQTKTVQILETLPPFMSVDGKLYKLKKGDIVSLPETNANILLRAKVAKLSKSKSTAKHSELPKSTVKASARWK